MSLVRAGACAGIAAGLSFPAAALAQSAKSVQVAVLDHPVARGQLLTRDDFTTARRDPEQAQGALGIRDAAGREAARDLPAGRLLRIDDAVAPRLVRRGDPVTINVRAAGLAISAQGKALSAGALGELVRVFSSTTNRTFDAVVEGADTVRLTTP